MRKTLWRTSEHPRADIRAFRSNSRARPDADVRRRRSHNHPDLRLGRFPRPLRRHHSTPHDAVQKENCGHQSRSMRRGERDKVKRDDREESIHGLFGRRPALEGTHRVSLHRVRQSEVKSAGLEVTGGSLSSGIRTHGSWRSTLSSSERCARSTRKGISTFWGRPRLIARCRCSWSRCTGTRCGTKLRAHTGDT